MFYICEVAGFVDWLDRGLLHMWEEFRNVYLLMTWVWLSWGDPVWLTGHSNPTTTTTMTLKSRLESSIFEMQRNGDSSVDRASDRRARRNIDAGSNPRCGKRFFSQIQLPVLTLLRCPYSPREQSHASTSMRTLNIPNTGSHTIVWTHKNTTHTDRNG